MPARFWQCVVWSRDFEGAKQASKKEKRLFSDLFVAVVASRKLVAAAFGLSGKVLSRSIYLGSNHCTSSLVVSSALRDGFLDFMHDHSFGLGFANCAMKKQKSVAGVWSLSYFLLLSLSPPPPPSLSLPLSLSLSLSLSLLVFLYMSLGLLWDGQLMGMFHHSQAFS